VIRRWWRKLGSVYLGSLEVIWSQKTLKFVPFPLETQADMMPYVHGCWNQLKKIAHTGQAATELMLPNFIFTSKISCINHGPTDKSVRDLHSAGWAGLLTLYILYVWKCAVSIVTRYGLEGRSLIPGRVKNFFSISQRIVRLSGPTSLLSNGYRGPFPRG
jgi:hypothetical protein